MNGIRESGDEPQEINVRFADATLSLEDPNALVVADPDARDEERFVCFGCDPEGRVLVTVYPQRGKNIRIVSVRMASTGERRRYEKQ